MPRVEPREGTVLAGYRMERQIGRGGMGVVYLAEHLRLHRPAALKLLAPELAADERFRRRFLRESELAASLDHPHIVPIYDAGEEGDDLYIAMRYVDGTDLGTLLRRNGALTPAMATRIVTQIASALDAAHEHGLVHRDVKPGNILLPADAGTGRLVHAYLCDFGLTTSAATTTGFSSGAVLGTVDYMAPERIEGADGDGRSDLYALACVAAECLTGRSPYRKGNDLATLWAHINDPPPKLPELGEQADGAEQAI